MALAADEHDADVVGMNDQNSGRANTGNLYIKHNDRTIKMMQTWLAAPAEARAKMHDQDFFGTLADKAWGKCQKEAECKDVKAKGQAAIWLHPW